MVAEGRIIETGRIPRIDHLTAPVSVGLNRRRDRIARQHEKRPVDDPIASGAVRGRRVIVVRDDEVGEEATETVIAAKNDDGRLASETADLLYHLMVLLVERGVPLGEISRELKERRGTTKSTKGT